MQGKTRAELIEIFDTKPNWSKNEIKAALAGMIYERRNAQQTDVKVGDVFLVKGFNHPAVVIKKNKEFCYALTLTTKGDNTNVLCPCNSRFFANSYVTCSLQRVSEQEVLDNFIFPYNNFTHLKQIKRKFKLFINTFI